MTWIHYSDIKRFVHVLNHSLIRSSRAHLSLIRVDFELLEYGQRRFWALLNLIEHKLFWSFVISDTMVVWSEKDFQTQSERVLNFELRVVLSEFTSVRAGLIRDDLGLDLNLWDLQLIRYLAYRINTNTCIHNLLMIFCFCYFHSFFVNISKMLLHAIFKSVSLTRQLLFDLSSKLCQNYSISYLESILQLVCLMTQDIIHSNLQFSFKCNFLYIIPGRDRVADLKGLTGFFPGWGPRPKVDMSRPKWTHKVASCVQNYRVWKKMNSR